MKTAAFLVVALACMSGDIRAQEVAGMALELDGSGDFVQVENSPSLNFEEQMTVEAWVHPSTCPTTGSAVVRKNQSPVSDPQYTLMAGSGLTPGVAHFNAGLEGTSASGSEALPLQEWTHLAGTYDGATVRVYRNGVEVGSAAASGPLPVSPSLLIIGGTEGSTSRDFHGVLDEVRIWSRARTQSQIRATMHDTLSASYYATADSGLVAYRRFDELENLGLGVDGADDVRDLSVHGNHGDLNGDAMLTGVSFPVEIEPQEVSPGTGYVLSSNYPNPFDLATSFTYTLPEAQVVTLRVYDVYGREVATLIDEAVAGTREGRFEVSGLASGLYLYSLQAGRHKESRRMTLIK